jgi:hypothetical protein
MLAENTFSVRGSCGMLVVDCSTGYILEVRHDGKDKKYDDIQRFDVAEWLAEYPGESLAGTCNDILDLGYWMNDGTYVEPCYDWRKQDVK